MDTATTDLRLRVERNLRRNKLAYLSGVIQRLISEIEDEDIESALRLSEILGRVQGRLAEFN